MFAEMKKDDLFTEHIEELCAEHDELDRHIDAIVAGDLSHVPHLVLLLKSHLSIEKKMVSSRPRWPTCPMTSGKAFTALP